MLNNKNEENVSRYNLERKRQGLVKENEAIGSKTVNVSYKENKHP